MTAREILYGKLQASAHCRLTNPILKFVLIILTLLVGSLFVGWQYPDAENFEAVASYVEACHVLAKYILLILWLLALDFRPGKASRSVFLGFTVATVFVALESVDLTTLKLVVSFFQGSLLGSVLEPLQLLVFVTFIMSVPLMKLTSSRDALIYARLLSIAFGILLTCLILWLCYKAYIGRQAAYYISLSLILCLVGTSLATARGRFWLRWIFSTGLLIIALVYYFLIQTLGPRLPAAGHAAISRWRLLQHETIKVRMTEFARAFGKVLGLQLSDVVGSAVSLLTERGILRGRLDHLSLSLSGEDAAALLIIVFAFLDGLRGIVLVSVNTVQTLL